MKYEWVYDKDSLIRMPDIQIMELHSSYTYVPLRGNAYIMLVLENKNPIGWIKIEKLGYSNVKEWIKEND